MKNVTVIFTCYNRKEKSVACINSLVNNNTAINFNFIVVDDGSTDGTCEAIEAIKGVDIHVITGNGNLYWCGGMRKGIDHYLKSYANKDGYCLLVNDDVLFYPHSIENMFVRLNDRNDYVIVGATCDSEGNFSYGLRKKELWYKKYVSKKILPTNEEIVGDMFNANCVLIPDEILRDVGNMDSSYTHGLGDYDYGFEITRKGYKVISTNDYVGECNGNPANGSWMDKSLSRRERLKKKESPKGSPAGEWWHFLYKNYGIATAVIHSIIPYCKILFKM